jgi:ubiquinone/menaquinone biosynthesis C-methylase UbiE
MPSPGASRAAASRRYFNRWAARYDRSLAQLWFQENYRLMVQAVDAPADARILDLGCGTGQLAARLAHGVRRGGVWGVDPAAEMIRVARRQHRRTNLRFAVGSSEAIPTHSAVFDVVVSTLSFHHWVHPAKSLREIARVLKPGGRVLILDLCRDNVLVGWVDQIQRWVQPSHVAIASAAEMRRYCAWAGVRQLRITAPRWFLMLAQGVCNAS